jgi:acyl-CoA thioester hydrolase
MFEKTLYAGWGDMDFNSHMGNSAFLNKCSDVRMLFFAEHGFPMQEFARLHIGPVIMKDELEYFREIRLLQAMRITQASAGLAQDGSRFLIRNEFWLEDGRLAARVTSAGGWLDLTTRRLTAPPEALLAALRSLPPTGDFQVLPSSLQKAG